MSDSAESAIVATGDTGVAAGAGAAAHGAAPPISLGTAIREALRGTHRDFTEGTVSHAILILAIPMVLEMIMESVFAVCDVFFVSKLGASAVATVGLTESWVTLVFALAMGLAIATSAAPASAIVKARRAPPRRAFSSASRSRSFWAWPAPRWRPARCASWARRPTSSRKARATPA
jgi:hypothetical protein